MCPWLIQMSGNLLARSSAAPLASASPSPRRRRAQPLSHHLERLLGLLDLALLGEQDAQPVGGEQVGLALLQRLGVHRRGVLQVFLHRLGGLLVRRGAVAVARALRPHRLVVRRVGHRDHRVLVRGVRRRLGVLARRRRELRRLRAQRLVRRAQQLELRLRVRPPALLHQQVPEERHRVGVRRVRRQRLARQRRRRVEVAALGAHAREPQQALRHLRRRHQQVSVPPLRVRDHPPVLHQAREVERHGQSRLRRLRALRRDVERLAGFFFSTVIALGVRRRQRAQEPPARLLEAAFVRASAGHRTQHAAVVQERRGRCAPGRDLRRPLVRRRRLGVLAGAEQRVAQLEARGEIRRVGVGGAAQRGGGLGVAPGARARLPDGHHAPARGGGTCGVLRPAQVPVHAHHRVALGEGGARLVGVHAGGFAVAARQRNLRQTKRGRREGFVQLRRRLVQRARARQVTAPVRGARARAQPPPSACPWRRRRRRRRAPRRFR